MRIQLLFRVVGAIAVLLPGIAAANTTWFFEGVMTRAAGDALAAGVVPGARIAGSIEFDPNIADRDDRPDVGWYANSIVDLRFEVGDLEIIFDRGLNAVIVRLDGPAPTIEGLSAAEGNLLGVTGLGFVLRDELPFVITDTSFPLSPPDIADLAPSSQLFFGYFDGGSPRQATAQITSMVVPEPGTGVLLGAGLIAAAWRRRPRAQRILG